METHALIHGITRYGVNLIPRQFNPGEIFLYQGEKANQIGIILSGKVFAQTYTQDGHAIWLEDFGPNQLIGAESLFSNAPLAYELITKTDAKIAYLSRDKLLTLIKFHDAALDEILKDMSSRLIRNIERLIEANTLSTRGRICAELKRHSKPIGIEPDKHIIRPKPVFSEFALRVGSTRESVSRTVSDLSKKGVIFRQTGALIISDMGKLEACII